ncbi:hypothetical protein [Clostridium sp. CF012]|uniref:hypothetical protein n=1 Tax=Clostridium sp. CF012 TaxID=2843319 RepID=UPI001C0D2A2C|nr:hypothetical protein [Clostridium sp. CF012]MBU3144621.1 hypothetical protein [Clostridium sp. CF012]
MLTRKERKNLYRLTAIEIYKLVLIGDIKSFPKGFWQKPDADKNAIEITRYLLEVILKWSNSDIKEMFSSSTFLNNKLCGMMCAVYNKSPFEAINSAYPNKFKPWEIKVVPKNYWTVTTGGESTKWLLEEKLKWSNKDICEKLNVNIFRENGLRCMLEFVFNNSTYNAINYIYPNIFKPWELNFVPTIYWKTENGIEATKWLIEEKMKWSHNDVKKYICVKIFHDNGLRRMLENVYDGRLYKALDSAYPNKFRSWDFIISNHSQWTLEDGIESTKWLIEEKLKWSDEDIIKKLSRSNFNENGLGWMLKRCFSSSVSKALNLTYPDKFKLIN